MLKQIYFNTITKVIEILDYSKKNYVLLSDKEFDNQEELLSFLVNIHDNSPYENLPKTIETAIEVFIDKTTKETYYLCLDKKLI